jgi:hypothetical protein
MDSYTSAVDQVHWSMDIIYRFSNRKINPKNPKITQLVKFYKKHPELFQNYILVPVNLHLGS